MMSPELVRALWRVAEPIHALTYFAPEATRAFEDAGLRGFWRGYFAGRAAPLGAVGAAPVVAAFHGFRPDFVGRAVPDVWQRCAPADVLVARLAGVDAAVRRHLGPDEVTPVAARVVPVLRDAAARCGAAGRMMFAANAAQDEPGEPHLALWHATTLLREHRGDGHVAALVANDVGPCAAHVLRLAATGAPPTSIEPYRGWDADDWAATADELRSRGWLDAGGGITAAGRAVHGRVEAATEGAAAAFVAGLDGAAVEALVDALRPLALRLGDGLIPYPNPMGVPRPAR
jgi:Helix-turn-helix family